ncbi:MAG TPA: hypothetical protein VGT05_03275 [Patescibacteria group bacterium]|nr:hypothetical protein [Patescibacteria group bacterium]
MSNKAEVGAVESIKYANSVIDLRNFRNMPQVHVEADSFATPSLLPAFIDYRRAQEIADRQQEQWWREVGWRESFEIAKRLNPKRANDQLWLQEMERSMNPEMGTGDNIVIDMRGFKNVPPVQPERDSFALPSTKAGKIKTDQPGSTDREKAFPIPVTELMELAAPEYGSPIIHALPVERRKRKYEGFFATVGEQRERKPRLQTQTRQNNEYLHNHRLYGKQTGASSNSPIKIDHVIYSEPTGTIHNSSIHQGRRYDGVSGQIPLITSPIRTGLHTGPSIRESKKTEQPIIPMKMEGLEEEGVETESIGGTGGVARAVAHGAIVNGKINFDWRYQNGLGRKFNNLTKIAIRVVVPTFTLEGSRYHDRTGIGIPELIDNVEQSWFEREGGFSTEQRALVTLQAKQHNAYKIIQFLRKGGDPKVLPKVPTHLMPDVEDLRKRFVA